MMHNYYSSLCSVAAILFLNKICIIFYKGNYFIFHSISNYYATWRLYCISDWHNFCKVKLLTVQWFLSRRFFPVYAAKIQFLFIVVLYNVGCTLLDKESSKTPSIHHKPLKTKLLCGDQIRCGLKILNEESFYKPSINHSFSSGSTDNSFLW